ncbi:O-methyltransferase [Lactococcus nasutitermitis]|uniref:tRNA 5-hydroxyuridine methyltransferase n=1 Tax=Lactococcus nasutitermitis TaxID=1652957 RepID=A0ABV9JEY7_9LACT|nr:O-methyltransferase [Lactococcus nasutitermitis]
MMNRPVVKAELVEFMRTRQTQLTGNLKIVEDFAHEHNIPVIPHETVVYFQFLLGLIQPKKILEIGTAIGFSALVMAEAAPNSKVTTIERNPEMAELAKENFAKFDKKNQIKLLEGDASEFLTELSETYDVVFMDSAKSKYVEFLPQVLTNLSENGIIVMDDIFQSGEILLPIEQIKRNQRALERGLRKLFDEVLANPAYLSTILPLGDGLLMIKKSSVMKNNEY